MRRAVKRWSWTFHTILSMCKPWMLTSVLGAFSLELSRYLHWCSCADTHIKLGRETCWLGLFCVRLKRGTPHERASSSSGIYRHSEKHHLPTFCQHRFFGCLHVIQMGQ